jgi:hypothetical protein
MSIFDQLQDVLTQYAGGNAAPGNPQEVESHFNQVAAVAPHGAMAEGVAAAFRSDQTPAFGNMLSGLFSQSNGEQKAGILNQLLGSAGGAGALAALAGSGGLASLLGGGSGQVTPEQAQQVSPETVQQLAAHAQSHDPSIIDKASAFYAEHPTLVKTLGGAALTLALAQIAEKQSQG